MATPTITSRKAPDSQPRPGTATAGSPAAQRSRNARIAGVLLSLAGVAILMGIVTAEALYPGVYTAHTNTVSHLGASEPPSSVVLQPSAAIFDLTMLVTGAMIVAGAWFAYRALPRKAVLIPTSLLGIGTLGVGIFPLTHPSPHTLFAFTAFLAGGVAAVPSARLTSAVDRVPDRPVAGGFRQLPAGHAHQPIAEARRASCLGTASTNSRVSQDPCPAGTFGGSSSATPLSP